MIDHRELIGRARARRVAGLNAAAIRSQADLKAVLHPASRKNRRALHRIQQAIRRVQRSRTRVETEFRCYVHSPQLHRLREGEQQIPSRRDARCSPRRAVRRKRWGDLVESHKPFGGSNAAAPALELNSTATSTEPNCTVSEKVINRFPAAEPGCASKASGRPGRIPQAIRRVQRSRTRVEAEFHCHVH